MKIGVLSSGGDCPGINATIRGVGKTAIMHYGMEVIGIHSGFVGLLNKDIQSFDERSLSGILNLGGDHPRYFTRKTVSQTAGLGREREASGHSAEL